MQSYDSIDVTQLHALKAEFDKVRSLRLGPGLSRRRQSSLVGVSTDPNVPEAVR